MSKASGLGANLYVAGVNLSGDVGSVQSIRTPRGVQDVTGIDKSALERILLTRDGGIDYTAFFNPADGAAHPVLSALPTADQPVAYVHRTTIGAPAAAMVAKQIGYDPTRDANGAISGINVQTVANGYGLEWGHMLTGGVATAASSGAQTGWDSGIATATEFGLQAYLHVFDIGSGSATVAVQDSDDDDDADPYANVTGAAFAAASAAPGSQRLETARDETVKRWLRVNVTGTFTDFDFAVVVIKNGEEVLFR